MRNTVRQRTANAINARPGKRRGDGPAANRCRAGQRSVAQRKSAHAPFDVMGAMMFDRENVDQVGEFEMVLAAANVDVNLVAANV